MKVFLKYLGFIIASLVLGFLSAPFFGYVYDNFLGAGLGGGLFGDTSSMQFIVGLPVSFAFFYTLIFYIFGNKSKFWWIIPVLVAFLALAIIVDSAHLYFHIGVVLIAFALGWGIEKLLQNSRKKA